MDYYFSKSPLQKKIAVTVVIIIKQKRNFSILWTSVAEM